MVLNPLENFWDNPQRLHIFSSEYEANTPSNVMWALHLIYHPKSEYFDMPLKARTSLVLSDFDLKDYDLTPHADTIDRIELMSMTKTQRSLAKWENKLEERDEFISSHPYDSNTYEMLDKLMSQTSKLWDQYFSLVKQLDKEEGNIRGGAEESLVEKGII